LDSFELNYDSVPVYKWINENHISFAALALALYVGMIVGGQAYFKTRPALNFRKTLAAWNLLLTVFSAVGFVRSLPFFFLSLNYFKGVEWFCSSSENHILSGSTGMWFQLWVLSKFP
jgi:elongation of very long chain fatty acids protein 6